MTPRKGGNGIGSRGREGDGMRGEGKGEAWCGMMLYGENWRGK